MGANQTNPQNQINQQQPLEIELSPLERWNTSQQNQQDLILFLENSQTLNQCSGAIANLLRSINNREKYQNYLISILDFLRSERSMDRYSDNDRRELFTLYSKKLKYSFFIAQEFQENLINYDLKPYQSLYFLYEYYSLSDELLQKAIFFNYPTIFTEFKEFLRVVVQSEVLITNEEHLFRFIIPQKKIEDIKNYFELISQSFVRDEYEKLLDEVRIIQNLKEIYREGVEELLKYDYADISSNFYKNLKAKGYEFDEEEMQYFLKIQLYCLFLYHFSKLSLKFEEMRSMSITEILHYFFINYDLQETPMLIKCFDIFCEPLQKWQKYIIQYIFSHSAHISTMIRLVEHRHVSFNGKDHIFQQLLEKVKGGNCQIGKYAQELTNLALSFDVDPTLKSKYTELIKLIQIYYIFSINSPVQPLYDIVFIDWQNLTQSASISIKQNGLDFLRKIIQSYFKQFDVKMKSIQIQSEQFIFSTIFDMLYFIQFIKRTFLNNFISNCITHQIFFKELIKHEHYIEIKALLSEQKQKEFEIQIQPIEMIITDHIISLLTTKRIKKIEQVLKLLFSILHITPSNNAYNSHYLLSYYNYLKYLQEKDVSLPLQMKEHITIENLYYIVNNYSNKIEQIDFNFLFTQQSCIKTQYTDSKTVFVPIVTDQFLKFKIFLCNKAYSVRKFKYGSQIIEEVIRYEPPWISTELVKIIRQNSNGIQENFIMIAFNFCARGEDLQYILNLYLSKSKVKGSSSKLSLLNLRSWANLLEQDKYLVLTDQVVINQALYKNLVAELTFNENEELKVNHYLFFHLLTIQPERSFNYAVNYQMPVPFVINFILEGIKKGVIHMRNVLVYLIRYLHFQGKKESQKLVYLSFKQYRGISIEQIISNHAKGGESSGSYTLATLQKMIRNYQIHKIVTSQFLDLYIHSSILFKFLYEETFRKKILVDLREQPMSKVNSKILKSLCERVGIDILELSIYNLVSRVNSKETIDDECWTIAQKLIYWGDDRKSAYSIVQKLSQKIEVLDIFVSIVDYLRESQPFYKEIVTDYHMEIVKSLAAVEVQKNLYGIIADNFFQREIGVYLLKNRGMLSEVHRRILKESGCVQNIFVLSKALYFMYGCNDEIEKVVLGEFSLQQEDSQQFQMLRKKIKIGNYE